MDLVQLERSITHKGHIPNGTEGAKIGFFYVEGNRHAEIFVKNYATFTKEEVKAIIDMLTSLHVVMK